PASRPPASETAVIFAVAVAALYFAREVKPPYFPGEREGDGVGRGTRHLLETETRASSDQFNRTPVRPMLSRPNQVKAFIHDRSARIATGKQAQRLGPCGRCHVLCSPLPCILEIAWRINPFCWAARR